MDSSCKKRQVGFWMECRDKSEGEQIPKPNSKRKKKKKKLIKKNFPFFFFLMDEKKAK